MDKLNTNKLIFGALWWLVAAVIAVFVYLRVSVGMTSHPFLFQNIVFIFVSVLLFRYIFFLRWSMLSDYRLLMIVLIFLSLPLFFYLFGQYKDFRAFWDEGSYFPFLIGDNYGDQHHVALFYRKEMIFFAITSLVATVLFPFRLLVAIWRKYNLGHV